MKKLMYLFIALFVGGPSLYAQDCATGYCPPSITMHHKAGDVSPTTVDISYEVVAIGTNCWLARNLGATHSGSSTSLDYTYAGWWFQWGAKRGYSTASSVPTSDANPTAWTSAQDPCTQSLGAAWHVPSSTEWSTLSISNFSSAGTAGKIPNVMTTQANGGGTTGTTIYMMNNGTWQAWTNTGMVAWTSSYIVASNGSSCGISASVYNAWANYTTGIPYVPTYIGQNVRCVKAAAN